MTADHETMTAEPRPRMYCRTTGNLSGTDTVVAPCICPSCRADRYMAAQSATIASLREAAKGATVIVNQAGAAIREKDAIIAGLRDALAVARSGLTRLRDCDWVITPADRMDAVREIARTTLDQLDAALKGAHPAQGGENVG